MQRIEEQRMVQALTGSPRSSLIEPRNSVKERLTRYSVIKLI